MIYRSTRGAGGVTASEAVIKGIAPDGGLYVPVELPGIFSGLSGLTKMTYNELAYAVLRVFLTDFTEAELRGCIDAAYGSGFEGGIAPVVRVGESYFLELFHGRTSAFKDMALSILPYLTAVAAAKTGLNEKPVVLTATSGDTGKAALEAFAGVKGTYIIVFYPETGVSYIQKQQMRTQAGDNTLVVGIAGNFDDAQTGVKAIFNDSAFNERLKRAGYALTSANSINIGRLLPQVVYYYQAYAQMVNNGAINMGDKLDFTVPTGNFGNILAGYYAKQTGLPIGRLLCASNENKVLYDFFTTGVYDRNRAFYQTSSPSMDILVSSNLERYLYHLCGDADRLRGLMDGLAKDGRFEFKLPGEDVAGGFATEAEGRAAIKEVYAKGYVMDTHTAVAYAALKKQTGGRRNVVVATASPYKFAEDVCAAIGERVSDPFDALTRLGELSGTRAPRRIAELKNKPVLHERVCACDEMADVVLGFLNQNALRVGF